MIIGGRRNRESQRYYKNCSEECWWFVSGVLVNTWITRLPNIMPITEKANRNDSIRRKGNGGSFFGALWKDFKEAEEMRRKFGKEETGRTE